MKTPIKSNSLLRSLTSSSISLIALFCGGTINADLLVSWDIPVSVSSPSVGSTQGTPSLGTGVAGASGITLTGSVNGGNTTSQGWRWYDGSDFASDLTTALEQQNYFAFNITASAIHDLSINGLGVTTFRKGGSAPNTLALLYSATNTWTPGNFREISSAVTLTTTDTDISAALAGDLGTTPIQLSAGSTGYFRIAYWGATSTSSGGVWRADTVDGNDFSLLGTATATATVRNLLWTGAGGNDWNTNPSNMNWADVNMGNAAAAFATNDDVTIDIAAAINVDAGGVSPLNLAVSNPSGIVSLSGGSITSATLAKTGAGTLVLDDPNSFSAGSMLSGGITEISNDDALGSEFISFASGTLRASSPASAITNPISLETGGGTIDNASAFSVGLIANSIVGNSFTKTGLGELTLTNGLGSTTVGPVNLTVSEGSVTVEGSPDVNLGAVVTLNGDLNLSGPELTPHNSEISGTGKIVFKDAASSIRPRFNAGAVRINTPILLEADGTVDSPNGNNRLDLYGVISGPFNFTKDGNGTVTLRTDNTYTGTTTINDNGTLRLSGAGNLGEGDVSITEIDGSLSFDLTQAVTVANLISGDGRLLVSQNSMAPAVLTNTNDYFGSTTINGPSPTANAGIHALVIADGGESSSIGASTSDPENLTLNGGSLTYIGAGNASTDRNFTLGINGGRISNIGTGTLDFSSIDFIEMPEPEQVLVGNMNPNIFYQIMVLGNTDWAALGAPAGFGVGTIFRPNGPGSGTGEVVFANIRSLVLDGTSPGISTFALTMGDPFNAPMSLVKSGTNTWSITGDDNLQSGPTTINGGILRFDGDNSGASGAISVNSGGSLGGNGSVGGAVTLNAGGGFAVSISDWTGVAGTGYDDLDVESIDGQSLATTLKVDAAGMTNFTEEAKSFTIVNTNGGITNYNFAAVTFDVTNFPGTGTWSLSESGGSLVLNYALAGTDPYSVWATGAPYNLSGGQELPEVDADGDDIANVVEFVIGGNPANVDDSDKLPTAVLDGTVLVISFRRAVDSAYLNPAIEYDTDLTGIWTLAQDGVAGVTIVETPDGYGPGIDRVDVRLPASLSNGGKIFARLTVSVP